MRQELFGLAEFAEAAGVNRELFAQWRHRGKVPDPYAELRSGPVWTARQVKAWLAKKEGNKDDDEGS